MNTPQFSRIVIVGVGLIGGSFALALKRAGRVREVIGVGRQAKNLQQALALGVIDQAQPLEQAVKGADLILLAVPVAQTEAVLSVIAPQLEPHTLITDGGSTKQDVISAARRALGSKFVQFVPAHPIAGSDQSGATAAFAELYQDRHLILCPESDTPQAALQTVRTAWQACGAKITEMSAAQHDAVFAIASHLPHLLAFSYMNLVLQSPQREPALKLAGSGFRDFTRIAGANPEMWADIACANKAALGKDLQHFQALLQQLQQSIEGEDKAVLQAFFTEASQARQQWKI